MRIIARRTLMQKAAKYGDCVDQAGAWYRVARAASWKSLAEARDTYRHADIVGELTVFNLKGNAYRLIVYIDYSHQIIYIKDLLSHADYSKQQWQ